jgi:NADH-quinone oxidoreductase subunit J
MASLTLYTATLLGAVALYLMLRPAGRWPRVAGAVLGLGALAWLAKELALSQPGVEGPSAFFFIFALIAVASAVRMITHSRPVYAALYFVMVVMASAGLFLLLEAEFMAFALIIVYAGAILITYLFVIMLVQQAPEGGDPQRQAEYDVIPREPATAALVGFVLLAVLSDMVVKGAEELPPPPSAAQMRADAWEDLEALPDRVHEAVAATVEGEFEIVPDVHGRIVRTDGPDARVMVQLEPGETPQPIMLPDEAMPENIQRVGLALISVFPVSLELAGVILLMAMFGAVVLAQRQIELAQEEKQ